MDSLSRALQRWSVASLICNMLIVVTGGLVRTTASGLGCPSWPECEPGSYVPQPELGVHGYIEFGNRLMTFVLIGVAAVMAWQAWRARRQGIGSRRLLPRSLLVGVGIIAQAVIGGILIRVQLNPWVVGVHLIVSVALIVVCTVMVRDAHATAAQGPTQPRHVLLSRVIFGLSMAIIYLGTVVTGAGPHSGDEAAIRNGFFLTEVARVHSLTMWLTLALTVVLAAITRTHPRLRRAAFVVLAVAAVQGVIGYTQYFTHLPIALVIAHLLGTTVFTVAVTHLWQTGETAQVSSGSSAAAMNTTAR